MNFKMVAHMLGRVMFIIGFFMLIPLFIAIGAKDGAWLSFLIPSLCMLAVGGVLTIFKPQHRQMGVSEGFVIVALAWILISVMGSLPFYIGGWIPNYVDAFYEAVSGFTTTGATIIDNVEIMPMSILFWRAFIMWLGGMGVLVFVIAVLPKSEMGVLHVFAAESPGPQVGKFVSKMRNTAQILYIIYFALTVLELIFLVSGGMPFFDAITNTFSTAGTGGYTIKNASIAFYDNLYYEIVITVFMFLFSTNFNLFYLIIIWKIREILKCEEIIAYLVWVVGAMLLIATDIMSLYGSFGEALRYSSFQVISLSSTTGFTTAAIDSWPAFSKSLLIVIMLVGSCAGSTGGGMKVSRFLILIKSFFKNIDSQLRPRHVRTLKFEGKTLDESTVSNVQSYAATYALLAVIGILLISLDGFAFETSLTAVITSLSNVGPILGVSTASGFSSLSKVVMSFLMLAGRLEIFPILFLFYPKTWRK